MESNIKSKKQEPIKPVLKSTDEKTGLSAVHSPYHYLTEEDIIRFMENEAVANDRVKCLLNKYLDEDGRPLSKQKFTSKKMKGFNIDEFV